MNTISVKNGFVSINVSVFIYKDNDYPKGDMFIAYCPSLNLCGYNTTREDAMKDFEYMLKEYIKEQEANGTLPEDLRMHGWEKTNDQLSEPAVSKLIVLDENLRDIMDNCFPSKVCVNASCPVSV